ncbi:MAG: fibronectin type III domain-containing protein, partial [Candidatus Glassbacteria bacterium]|nr:fibronectin type III domain-containing protein [Candidatus Glassbacteria bacterium]
GAAQASMRGDLNDDGKVDLRDVSVMLERLSGEEPLVISDLLLSNHTGTACALSWRTNKPTAVNRVSYGLDRDSLDMVSADSASVGPGLLHFARLVWLQPDTVYFYRVMSDGLEFAAGPSGVDSLITWPQALSTERVTLQGQVADLHGNPLAGVLVRSRVSGPAGSSSWYTVLTRPDGIFSMEFANYRSYDGRVVRYQQNQSMLHLCILGRPRPALQDSILLTVSTGTWNQNRGYQDLGTYRLSGTTEEDLDESSASDLFDLLVLLGIMSGVDR